MIAALMPRELRPVYEAVLAGERISDAQALTLYASRDLNALGALADVVRERKNGNVATYLLNRYINYSNVCLLSCQFCAFAAKKRDAHAFEKGIPGDRRQRARRADARASRRSTWSAGCIHR